jgi:hypothetical protein
MEKHPIHLTEGAPRSTNANLKGRVKIKNTRVVQANAADLMEKHPIQVTEGAPRGTNANLNLLAAFVIKNTIVFQTNAADLMEKHSIQITEGAPQGTDANLKGRVKIKNTLVVQANASDMMMKHTIRVTEGAPRGTNANLNLLQAFVIKNTRAANQGATEYRERPACTELKDAQQENISANSLRWAGSVKKLSTVKRNDPIQKSHSIHIIEDCIFICSNSLYYIAPFI